jgi:asparagine synthetase B (glutamine-hydrolysing)
MTGLVGVYDSRASDQVLEHVAERMCRAAALRMRSWTVGAGSDVARCGVFHHDSRDDHVARARDIWLVFDGELYNRVELEQRVGRQDADTIGDSDAALCLALLSREGDSFVHLLNGQFNLAIYRALDARLSIATDRSGYRPLFVTRRGNRVLFATALKAIFAGLETAPSIDGIGLLQAMRRGWSLGSRTWAEGIAVADPGAWLHIDRDGWRQERYYRLRFAAGACRDVEAHAEGLAAVLRRAVRRTTDDGRRFGLPLSGGLDSRSILLSTTADRRPAVAYTFGRGWSFDVNSARQLAAIAGVRHRAFPYDEGYLGRVLEGVVWLTEGLTGFAHSAFTSFNFHDRIAEDADVLLYGHAGDCLTGAHLRPWIGAQRSVGALIERTFHQSICAPEPVLKRVFNASFYRRHVDDLFDAMRESFAGIDGDTLADIADVWDMENRQRRGTFASCAVDRCRFAVRAPFLDNDVVDHLRRAPLRWRILQLGYKHMIVKSCRESARVPWAYTGRPLHASLPGDFLQQGWNYLAKRLRDARVDPRLFRDLTQDTRSDPVLAQSLTDFVRHPHFPGDVFDRAGIEDVVRRHWDRQNDLTDLVIMLATFATVWRLFIYGSPPASAAVLAFPFRTAHDI